MNHGAPVHDDDPFTISGAVYREAAAYVASFVEHAHQRAIAQGEPLSVDAASAGLTDEDRRVLQ